MRGMRVSSMAAMAQAATTPATRFSRLAATAKSVEGHLRHCPGGERESGKEAQGGLRDVPGQGLREDVRWPRTGR